MVMNSQHRLFFSLVQPRPRWISFLLISLFSFFLFFFSLKFKYPSFIQGSHFQILISEIWGFISYFSKKDLLVFETNTPCFSNPRDLFVSLHSLFLLSFPSLFLALTGFPWFLSCLAGFQKEC